MIEKPNFYKGGTEGYMCTGSFDIEDVGQVSFIERGITNVFTPVQQSNNFVREYYIDSNKGDEFDSIFVHAKEGKEETCTEENQYGFFDVDPKVCRDLRNMLPCEEDKFER